MAEACAALVSNRGELFGTGDCANRRALRSDFTQRAEDVGDSPGRYAAKPGEERVRAGSVPVLLRRGGICGSGGAARLGSEPARADESAESENDAAGSRVGRLHCL